MIHVTIETTMTQTCDLVKHGDVEGLQKELEGGEVEEGGKKLDLTCRSCDGRTPLELAAVLGRPDAVKLLLKAGAPPNQASSSGYTALHLACAWNQLECVRELVLGRADHRLLSSHNETAQHIALRYGYSQCAHYLTCVENRTELSEAVQSARDILSDTDVTAGRWSRDDKSKVSSLCAEKTEWLEEHLDCSLEEVTWQKRDFESRLQPFTDKLVN